MNKQKQRKWIVKKYLSTKKTDMFGENIHAHAQTKGYKWQPKLLSLFVGVNNYEEG